MTEGYNHKMNIKGVIHKCGNPKKDHYSPDNLHSCSCGYMWDIRGKYIKQAGF
ncbi:MAG: hypothetical protein ACYDAP_00115 [Thermoplasmataceae archaeon]